MGLAGGQGGEGLQASGGEGKFNKRLSMANVAPGRALRGQKGGWGGRAVLMPALCGAGLCRSEPPSIPGRGRDNPANAP